MDADGALTRLPSDREKRGHESHFVAKAKEEPSPGVEDDDGTEVSNVGVVINRRAANVKRDFARLDGGKGFQFVA